jgi:hypothetical protein
MPVRTNSGVNRINEFRMLFQAVFANRRWWTASSEVCEAGFCVEVLHFYSDSRWRGLEEGGFNAAKWVGLRKPQGDPERMVVQWVTGNRIWHCFPK